MAGPGGKAQATARAVLRLDKWLWHARFFRARSDAAEAVTDGRVRLNGQRVLKPGHSVGVGDVLTFVQGGRVRLVRILALSVRRGPADSTVGMYFDLDAPAAPNETSSPLE